MKIEQRLILNDLSPDFKRENQTQFEFINFKRCQIIDFIKSYVKNSHAAGIILGISGGIDSFLVGALCAQAMHEYGGLLHLVILPNGQQADYSDALLCIKVISDIYADLAAETVSIKNGFDGAIKDLKYSINFIEDNYTLGNLQPRLRMMYQYALGKNLLVAGTDHCAEAMTGFYTKYGDGGTDINPIQELIKDDIYEMAKMYNAPKEVIVKKPAAGLGISLDDESELGITYKDICKYLRGEIISKNISDKIENIYIRTAHKRNIPASPKSIYMHKTPYAIIVVDFINAFINGSMPCKNADEAIFESILLINSHPEAMVLYICDSHPNNHVSFQEYGGQWPIHAVNGTIDAEISPKFFSDIKKSINTPRNNYNVFLKGQSKNKEQYSGYEAENKFFGPIFKNLPKDLVVVGAATEYCVKQTVFDMLSQGFNVRVIENCLAYLDKESHKEALAQMYKMGADIIYYAKKSQKTQRM